jgi:hypothetical protein
MEQTILDKSIGGVSLISLVFSFVGAALGISYMPPMSKTQMFGAVLAGLACGSILPELAILVFSNTEILKVAVVKNALCFLLGILGMFIIPGVIVFGQSFQKNPFFVLDWLRGKGPPPGGTP